MTPCLPQEGWQLTRVPNTAPLRGVQRALRDLDEAIPLTAHRVILDEVFIMFVDGVIGQMHADITLVEEP